MRGRCTSACVTGASTTCGWRSTSRRASSRRSCAAGSSPRSPDITARICGICPVAYQMSAMRGDGGRLRRRVSPEIRALRRLLYCGEWVESHALHVFMLHAPDFLGYQSAFEMAREHRADRRGRARAQEGRQRADARWSAVARSIRSTCASAASTARRRGPSSERSRPSSKRRAHSRAPRWTGSPTSPFPALEEVYELVALCRARQLRDRGRPPALERRARPGARPVRGALRRGARGALDRPALAAARRRRRLPGRPARAVGAARRPALADGARGGRGGRARARCARNPFRIDRRARRGDPLRPRRGAADHRRVPAGGPGRRSRSCRARASATAGARRHAACCGTGTGSTRAARSSTPRSSRRPRRTRPASSRPAQFVERHMDLPTSELRERCESAIRSYDPCISCARTSCAWRSTTGDPLVIGVGNPWRGDDGAGIEVARQVGGVDVRGRRDRADRRVGPGCGRRRGRRGGCGSRHRHDPRFDAAASPLPARSLRSSSHHFGVADAVELARSLDRLPKRLTVYAIEGEDFGAGHELSPAVRRSVAEVVEELSRASSQCRGSSDPQSPRTQDPP